MEGEERNKVRSKRRARRVEVGFDSGDDETIGSFLKLKSKRNTKKNKLGLDRSRVKDSRGDEKSLVDDEDLVGMDDTLASFRRKLRAPKKDSGCVALVGKDLGSNFVALSNQPLHQLVEDVGFPTKVSEEVLVHADGGNKGTVDKGLEQAAERNIRKPGVTLEVEKIGCDFEPDDTRRDHQRSGKGSSKHEKEVALVSGGNSLKCSDDGLEDSLSTFFRKAQSGFNRKSRSFLGLELEKETKLPSDGSCKKSNDILEDQLPEFTRKSPFALSLSNEVAESNKDVHQAPSGGVVDPVLMCDETDNALQVNFSCPSSSAAENSSCPLVACEALRSSENFADVSTLKIPENTGSPTSLRICSNTLLPVQHIGLTCQSSSFGLSPEGPKMKATDILSHSEIPVSVSVDDSHFDEGASLKVSSIDRTRSNSVSLNHAPEADQADQRTCTLVGGKALLLSPDYESPSRKHEDKSPSWSRRQVSVGIMEPSASLIEDSSTLQDKNIDAENSHDELNSVKSVKNAVQVHMVQPLSHPIAPEKELSSKHHDYLDKDADNGIAQTIIASISPGKEHDAVLEHDSSPVSASKISNYETNPQGKDQEKSSRHSDDSYNSYESPTPDDSAVIRDEDAKGTSSPSDVPDFNENYAEPNQMLADSENKTGKLSAVQRRKAKKRRHGDMAYEGDADWEVLMQEQEFLVTRQLEDGDQSSKIREKFSSSFSTNLNTVNGGAAAVSAGLKARAVGPVEKIKFKDILKRKGGLQEYLECRNFILSLWNKDVSRILPLSDCGVSDTHLVDESPPASLVRDIYAFLDQSGYINFGVASEKAENGGVHSLKLLKDENFVERSGAPASDANDGVSFILGRVKNSEIVMTGGKQGMTDKSYDRFVDLQADNNNTRTEPDRLNSDNNEENGASSAKVPQDADCFNNLGSNPSSEDENSRIAVPNSDIITSYSAEVGSTVPALPCEDPKASSNLQSTMLNEGSHPMICNSDSRKRIIVVGAGPAGLTAARHLQRQGFHVTVLEGRDRIGGRVFTDRSSLSVPVDLGASIITGVEADVATERRADPSSLVCAQLGLELTVLNSDCPLYDTVSGQKVPADLDEALEAEYNSLLDDMLLLVAQKGEHADRMSLEDGLEYALEVRRRARGGRNLVNNGDVSVDEDFPDEQSCKAEILSPLERRVMDWHFANLEYGCAALLKEVSLPYWNQDDVYGGFGGAHCMIKGGYGAVVESLGEGLNIHLNHIVSEISYSLKDDTGNDDQCKKVKVSTLDGKEFSGDAVLITVPLGCLKAETIKFSPSLPQWKSLSIKRLGFGVLNKVVMEFPEVFWDDSIDYFGATAEETNQRGRCFMFWNVKKTVGAPVLIALVVGKAAIDGQSMSSSDHVNHALLVLRKLFGESAVPDPIASVVTDWGRDPYSYGAYSYVAVGSSGDDYDLIGRPVENCLFFAGEATCKEHPDTVGGAMMSGLREAVRIIDILTAGTDYTAEVEVLEAAKRHSDVERSEIRDIIKRLDAIELSNIMYKNSLDQTQMLTRESLLKDMFYNAKTTAGRLHVVKELLKLPAHILKSFAGNKVGLSILNSWMLDSMGKDGTQLLRHCVRLLVLVSTDLLAVRLSGIGKTVKEKVCVHTSRDIRAIASQLVSVWIEIFRREKASHGGLKLLRQPTGIDSSKNKCVQASGRPPLRTSHVSADNRGSTKIALSKNNLHSSSNIRKVNIAKAEVKSSSSQGSDGKQNSIAEGTNVFPMTEEEKAAFAAAEAARAAAVAAAEAYASGIKTSTLQLPKIPSFHKFARREQYARMDESEVKRIWSSGAYGKQDCLSEIDSRNCRVRDWPVDFSAAGVNLDTSKMSIDNRSQQSHSNEIAGQLNFREHSGESVAVDSGLLTKAWVDSAGSEGIKDYSAIERWQCQAAAANSDYFHQSVHITDEEDSNMTSRLPAWKHDARANESSASQVTVNKELVGNQPRDADCIKRAVIDYVASLLMPLYKARKIDKDGYKSIMKKTATKVMEQTTDAEKAMAVFEFLDFKRKNKIRAFVDRLIERHMATKAAPKS